MAFSTILRVYTNASIFTVPIHCFDGKLKVSIMPLLISPSSENTFMYTHVSTDYLCQGSLGPWADLHPFYTHLENYTSALSHLIVICFAVHVCKVMNVLFYQQLVTKGNLATIKRFNC